MADSNGAMTMRELLRGSRKRARKTQVQIANELGISQKTLSNWEKGIPILLDMSERVAEAYQMTLEDKSNFLGIDNFRKGRKYYFSPIKDKPGVVDVFNQFRALSKKERQWLIETSASLDSLESGQD